MQINITEEYIQRQLFSMQDPGYKDFHSKLMPTIDKKTIIGVRTPELRKFAKCLAGTPEAEEFLEILPHIYYEENNLHGFLVERIKDYETCIRKINEFLPYINNWATCDLMTPRAFGKHLPELLTEIKRWIRTEDTYTVRFGIEMLMKFYLDEHFSMEYPLLVAGVKSKEYYVNMMIAWYFATALAKQYDAILPFVEEKRLEKWTHNKTIKKAIESYRITGEQKAYLRTLKIK